MAVSLKQYIKLNGNSPLDALLLERPVKAYMVALLALEDDANTSADHYKVGLASVYAAMSFYEENRQVIENELTQAEANIREVGQDGWQAIVGFKKHLDDKFDN